MVRCEICNIDDSTAAHKSSDTHRFNYLLFEWKNYRKKLVKNKHGIAVSHYIKSKEIDSNKCTNNENKGTYTITVSSGEFLSLKNKLLFGIKILNERNEDTMYIMKATILVPYNAFRLEDQMNANVQNNVIELKPKQEYKYSVHFTLSNPYVGSYKIPLGFTFQKQDDEAIVFSIVREIVVNISDSNEEPEDKSKSPFKFGVWDDIIVIIPPIVTPRQTKNYEIPQKYYRIFATGLSDRYISSNETYLLNYVRNCISPNYERNGEFTSQYPTEKNYRDFFHFLLWIDEVGQELMLRRYNMSNVTMRVIPRDMLELEVPGLAEKRPSLISGDIVNIRFHGDHTVYKAVVNKINDQTIWIKDMHTDLLESIRQNEKLELDVAFQLNRLVYERMHKAIDECIKNDLLKVLFPNEQLAKRNISRAFVIPDGRFFHKSISANYEQKIAVLNILNCTSQSAPYIVFGPPGTGKTLTIVEAILQISHNVPNSKILVCAPANAACDMLTEKLLSFITNKRDLIRIHTESRNWDEVPEIIKPYSNHNGTEYLRIRPSDLPQYRIVITTLCLIGKYSGQYYPDYVFIDEAAQAMEPESDIAVSMLQVGKQLVLAGDPKQLGPQCASAVAAKFKLENSLLQRLMDTNFLYKHNDNRFITMLKLNYRAHPLVLEVPNKLFYEGQLKAVNKQAANDPIAKKFIHPLTLPRPLHSRTLGLPIEFCSVMDKERREGKSPSYYNEAEIQMVVKYIEAILSLREFKVLETDIGVVTPYIRQVHRIKNRLRSRNYNNIEVGTTEVFQGREKRIIIISTVRSQHDLLLIDEKYKLGFVKNEKRMNVALTRAMSKLVVIGNPHVLGTDKKNWEFYIKFCEENNAFFASQYLRRTKAVRSDIIARLSKIKLGDIGVAAQNASTSTKTHMQKRKGK